MGHPRGLRPSKTWTTRVFLGVCLSLCAPSVRGSRVLQGWAEVDHDVSSTRQSVTSDSQSFPTPDAAQESSQNTSEDSSSEPASADGSSTEACSSVFIPEMETYPTVPQSADARLRSQWDHRRSMFLETCRQMETQAMDLVSEIGDFPSLQDFWEELESPTSNYTILLPPQEDLLLLENALFHLNLYRPAVFNSLLLHVVQGRYSLEDMTELAGYREGIPTMAPRPVETINGDQLEIAPRALQGTNNNLVEVSYGNNTAYLLTTQEESCRNGSMILEVSSMLTEESLRRSLDSLSRATHGSYHTEDILSDPYFGESSNKSPPPPFGVFAIPIVLVVLVLLFVVVMNNRELTILSGRDRSAPVATDASATVQKPPEGSDEPVVPPKVLHRVDSQRWSIKPPATMQLAVKDSTPGTVTADRALSSEQKPVMSRGSSVKSDTFSQKDTACVICYEREGDHVLLPCGHGGFCGACAHTLLKHRTPKRLCPMCRAELASIAKVNMSTLIGAQGDVLEASVGKPSVKPPSKQSRRNLTNPTGAMRHSRERVQRRSDTGRRREILTDAQAEIRERRVRRALGSTRERLHAAAAAAASAADANAALDAAAAGGAAAAESSSTVREASET